MAKAMESFTGFCIRTAGGTVNCLFNGRVVRGMLFFRVAKRFLSYARHCSYKNLDWDTNFIKKVELFNDGNSRGSRQDGHRRRDTDMVAATLDGSCGSFV